MRTAERQNLADIVSVLTQTLTRYDLQWIVDRITDYLDRPAHVGTIDAATLKEMERP